MKNKKTIFLILLIGVVLAIVLNIKTVLGIFPWLWHVLEVLVIGGCIAFLVNIIMDWFSRKVFTPERIMDPKRRRVLNLTCSLLLIIIILVAVFLIIIPQLVETIKLLFQRTPVVLESLRSFLESHTSVNSSLQHLLSDAKGNSHSISTSAVSLLRNALPKTFDVASTGVHFVMNFLIALIFSLYVLLSKNALMKQGRKLCYSYLPKKWANEVLYICHLTYRNFRDFIFGRFVDALSMAILYAIAALILRIPNTLMISTMIAVFCLIPLFGALIAWIIGVILIVTVSPVKAIIFSVLIAIILLFARNVIYPRVIGTSIGLPDIWVLAAIIVGGKMLGLLGMIIAVPVFGVIYTLIQQNSQKNLKTKEVKENEYDLNPNWENYNPETMEFNSNQNQNESVTSNK